ncbi:hypothetical protein KFK09_028066 [Dendrobium nobile]|uniref:Protein kinase domain-containing protein n=1 Tax=Dendrobium nobile TaxID=94219 RepID=A0A8T3A2F5_DENNO|nr:hypothetical protein KFK09_028066 [Dendrobium nobile]
MEISKPHLCLLLLNSLVFVLLSAADDAQLSHGYNCSSDRSIYPCKSYAFYLAGADSSLLDLASIGDLFGVSRLMIARATNLSYPAAALSYGQPLLIPLPCSCISNHSYSPVDYQIRAGDTYYLVSTFEFSNLTSYPAVEVANPLLVPTNLTIGVMVTFPIFCQCPKNRSQFIITYVFQPSDSYASIASRFGSDVQILIDLNGREGSVQPYSTILIPVSRIPSYSMSSSAPPPSRKRHLNGAVVGLSIALGLMGLFWVVLLLQISRLKKRCGWTRKTDKELGENKIGVSSEQKPIMDISEWLDRYKLYKIEELKEATADFDSNCLIRGSVYRGEIGREVYAIKKMKWNAADELKILQKVNHTNLVKLEGFCIDPEPGNCCLVYEYVSNGSLHSWLHGLSRRPHQLDWRSRLRIALDLAHGLQYIHEHTLPRVVHKDIKSSNVLLDSRLRAKIANFGLARSGHNAVTTHIVGTQGYVSPEYITDGIVSTKMDVFAYGVVMLELLTGREAVTEEGRMLWVEAEGWGKGEKLEEWMDEALAVADEECPVESLVMAMKIAKACLQREPGKRPTMVEVVYALAKADDMSADFSGEGMSVGASGRVVAR